MTTRTAACHCGALSLECEGEPRKVSMCHCRECQRRTGSLFSVAVFYTSDHVALPEGGFAGFTRASASGFAVTFHFCTRCGTNLWWVPVRLPMLVGVAAGCFADPDFPAPDQSVWTQDRHRWITLPEAMPCFDANPPPHRPAPG